MPWRLTIHKGPRSGLGTCSCDSTAWIENTTLFEFPDGGYRGDADCVSITHHLSLLGYVRPAPLLYLATSRRIDIMVKKQRLHHHIYLNQYFPNMTDRERYLEARAQ